MQTSARHKFHLSNLSCQSLRNTDLISLSDPYVVITVYEGHKKVSKTHTPTIQDDLDPVWTGFEWTFESPVPRPTIKLKVYNNNRIKDGSLGSVKHVCVSPFGKQKLPLHGTRGIHVTKVGGTISFVLNDVTSVAAASARQIKLLLLGEANVGKTTIFQRFMNDSVSSDALLASNNPAGEEGVRNIKVFGKDVRLSLWDTGGAERFSGITSSFYSFANGILLAYDISDASSFENLSRWIKSIERYVPGCYIYVIGTKLDLASQRQVRLENVKQMFSDPELNMTFVGATELCALTSGVELNNAISKIVTKILEHAEVK